MNTPAGWYDDGSGRQRWWDGQQWSEHYAPESGEPGAVAAPAMPGEPAAAVKPVATKPSIIGLIALGAAVLGTILACIPFTMVAGWILLPIAFVLSIIAFFIAGKKWAPITAISISVVGTIIAIVVAIIVATVALSSYVEEVAVPSPSVSSAPSDAPSDEPSDAPSDEPDLPESNTDDSQRPTSEEVGAGLGEIFAASGADTYPEEQLTCIGDALVESDIDNETLQTVADGRDAVTDPAAAELLGMTLASAMVACLMP